MEQVLAQKNLEAVLTAVVPLVPFVSGKSCDEGTKVLVSLLKEGLEGQEASSKRVMDLKKLKGKELMEFLSPAHEEGERNEEPRAKRGSVTPKQAVKAKRPRVKKRAVGADTVNEKVRSPVAPAPLRRKAAEKAGLRMDQQQLGEEEGGEEAPALLSSKKKSAKKNAKKALFVWDGEQYPKITKVIKCQGEGPDFSLDIYAKQPGRGHWIETQFSLSLSQLGEIDSLTQSSKAVVAKSFQKAAIHEYGQEWPSALKAALAGTSWAKSIVPTTASGANVAGDGLESEYAQLEDLGVEVGDLNNINNEV